MTKDVLSIRDIREELPILLEQARKVKQWNLEGHPYQPLQGRTLAMIFEKKSTRTRVSFEVGMYQLGGRALFLGPADLQLGRGESIADTAAVLSRYVDGIMFRAFRWQDMEALARSATVPVINGLDDREHPCQILADLQTLREHKGSDLSGRTLAYVGDGNNVCHSLLLGCAMMGMSMRAGCPDDERFLPDRDIVVAAQRIGRETGATIELVHDAKEAVAEVDAIYTDTWTSMGDEGQEQGRKAVFAPFQVNEALVAGALHDAVILHCLPAHRGEEITDAVLDGPQSVVLDQAENRLHAQKSLLAYLLG